MNQIFSTGLSWYMPNLSRKFCWNPLSILNNITILFFPQARGKDVVSLFSDINISKTGEVNKKMLRIFVPHIISIDNWKNKKNWWQSLLSLLGSYRQWLLSKYLKFKNLCCRLSCKFYCMKKVFCIIFLFINQF